MRFTRTSKALGIVAIAALALTGCGAGGGTTEGSGDATGDPNKVIANRLSITEATVKVHIKGVLKKIPASNRTQAAVWAIENGIEHRDLMIAEA